MSIEKAYNSWAKQYDSNENKTRDLDAIATIKTLSKYQFENVIELGCGSGKNTIWLAKKARKIIGLDFSFEMLAIAKQKVKSDRVEFKKIDLNQDWEVENAYADLITSSLTLEHIQDLNLIFSKASQKIKKDGIFFISELHPFKQYLGSKARYETEQGTEELTVFTHHISDYLENAKSHGFKLLEIKEWMDTEPENNIPRLISFVFQKTKDS